MGLASFLGLDEHIVIKTIYLDSAQTKQSFHGSKGRSVVLYRLYSPPPAAGDVRGGAARSLRNYLNAHSPKPEEDSWAHRKFMMYRRLRPTCGVPAVAQGPLPQGRSSRVCYPHLSVSRPTTAGRCQRSPFPSFSLFIHLCLFVLFPTQPNFVFFSRIPSPTRYYYARAHLHVQTCAPVQNPDGSSAASLRG